MRHLLTLALAITGFPGFAQNKTPRIPATAKKLSDFVPADWKIIHTITGDLNKDGVEDAALIIEHTDPGNFIKNEGMGGDTLNTNPRILLVLFKDKTASTYRLAVQNTTFLPPPNDAESPCLADPLSETAGVTISKGLLAIHFQYWYSCGSWYTSNHDYLFRYRNSHFQLIGFDSEEFHRSSGEISSYSINFSTKKRSHTTGENMFEETKTKPVTTWKKFTASKMMQLDQMTGDSFEKIMKITEH